MKKQLLILLGVVVLAACAGEPPPKLDPIAFDYSRMGPIALNTQDFNIINRSPGMPFRAPFAAQATLSDALNKWAADRIHTVGTMGHATMIIKDASVTSQPLRMETGFNSWFKRQQAMKYVAHVEADLDTQAPNGSSGYATAHAEHSVTLPEDATPAEKYEAYKELVDATMHAFNQNMDASVRQHLGAFLSAPQ